MKIGLIDVDSHGFPNLAIMKISMFHKRSGDKVSWAEAGQYYDKVYASKIFTFSEDFDFTSIEYWEIERGGTGYDIKRRLPEAIEKCDPDYSIYDYPFSIQFFSRGCIRHCDFCLVHEKEGVIKTADPMALNPNGKWIEVLDNNFFANPRWKESVDYLLAQKQKVNLHGVDVRILNEEQAYWLNKLPLKANIKIAWDDPNIDLTKKLEEVCGYIKPYKMTCYILVGFGSSRYQDLFRIMACKRLGITPFVMKFRDYENNQTPDRYQRDLARWCNIPMLMKSTGFDKYVPRKNFDCRQYLTESEWANLNKPA